MALPTASTSQTASRPSTTVSVTPDICHACDAAQPPSGKCRRRTVINWVCCDKCDRWYHMWYVHLATVPDQYVCSKCGWLFRRSRYTLWCLLKVICNVFHKIDEKVVSCCLLQYKPACVINFDKLRTKMLKRTSLVVFLVQLFFGNRHAWRHIRMRLFRLRFIKIR